MQLKRHKKKIFIAVLIIVFLMPIYPLMVIYFSREVQWSKSVPGFDLIITSALKRTFQPVRPFFDKNILHESWAAINEINWGIHEGKESKAWMIEAYNEMVGQWALGNFDASLEEGEAFPDSQAGPR